MANEESGEESHGMVYIELISLSCLLDLFCFPVIDLIVLDMILVFQDVSG